MKFAYLLKFEHKHRVLPTIFILFISAKVLGQGTSFGLSNTSVEPEDEIFSELEAVATDAASQDRSFETAFHAPSGELYIWAHDEFITQVSVSFGSVGPQLTDQVVVVEMRTDLPNVIDDEAESRRDEYALYSHTPVASDDNDVSPPRAIREIYYWGNDSDDDFDNQTDIASQINGYAGNDVLRGGRGRDLIYGGWGNDLIIGRAKADRLNGGTDDDFIFGGSGGDIIEAGDGEDLLCGGSGADRLNGGLGDDRLEGGEDGDIDELTGGNGSNAFEVTEDIDIITDDDLGGGSNIDCG